MSNERIEHSFKDLSPGELAPSQSSRTNFTPGKPSAGPLEENWPTNHKLPVGTKVFREDVVGPVDWTYNRVNLTGRNTVCDQTHEGISADSEGMTFDVDKIAENERRSGYTMGQEE